jgi:peroxiredoxin
MQLGSGLIIISRAILAAALILFLCPLGLAQTEEGQKAPDFSLQNLQGETIFLKDLRGKIVVLDFWATWCLPCRKSLPELAELDKKYRDKKVVFLGLSIDDPDSYDNQYVAEFKNKYKVAYQVLRANSGVVADYLGSEDVRIPAFVILDKKGIIVKKHMGFEQGMVEKILIKLLSAH